MGNWTGRRSFVLGLTLAIGTAGQATAAAPAMPAPATPPSSVVPVQAQPKTGGPAQPQPPPKKSTAKSTPGVVPDQPKTTAGPGADAGLRQRVEQLEEQLTDIQVTLGTLESLARAPQSAPPAGRPGQPAPSATFNAADAARTEQLEVQLRALVQQVEQLSDRLRQLEGGRAAPPPRAAAPPSPAAGFGTTTVTPAPRRSDQIADVIGSETRPAGPASQSGVETGRSPKDMYEQAYGFLLALDYAAAETAFTNFLGAHPEHELAGNAQFWLGETHYFRNQFKAAAAAYYKGYQTYGRSLKAPDSLLKLALSLDRLGQREAACRSFGELTQRFPNASPQIKARADTEAQRMGCQ